MSLLDSNRKNHKDVKPKKIASVDDLNSEVKEPKRTSMSIDTSIRNKLQAMVIIGDADNMKEGVVLAIKSYYDHLSDDKKRIFDSMYHSLEKRDN